DASIVKHQARVIPMIAHDVSPALRDIPSAPISAGVKRVIPNRQIHNALPTGSGGVSRAAEQDTFGTGAGPTPGVNFEGVGEADAPSCNCAPPDTNGDVGPNHYVQVVNTDI